MRRGTSGINALIALNKPTGMTSHDCVARVRKCVGEKRVGHAGTLDPDASGVLVIGIGQATRLMGQLTSERKSYLARITFGTETTTDDAEGEVLHEASVPSELFNREFALQTLKQLEGSSMQVPPAYSAISVEGVRAYSRARAGEKVELKPRPIEVFKAELVRLEFDEALRKGNSQVSTETLEKLSWLVNFEVSKGTYIRALARDLGRSLGSAAHLSALMRSCSGNVSLSDCVSLEDLEAQGASLLEIHKLDPARALGLPTVVLDASTAADVACGKRPSLKKLNSLMSETGLVFDDLTEGAKLSLVYENKLVGIWRRQGFSLVCDTNFPVGIEGVQL